MIKNEHQYRVTKAQITRLEKALEIATKTKSKLHPDLRQAMLKGIKSQIQEMKEEVAEYNNLRYGQKKLCVTMHDLSELPTVLIKARIARGMTQQDLANTLYMKPQQIQRYESTDYRAVSFRRVIKIAGVLNVHLNERIMLTKDKLSLESKVKSPV